MHEWKPGDKSWLHCPQVPLATSPKLLRPWRGPVEIVQVARPQCVRIKWGKHCWYCHPSRLKPFVAPHTSPTCPKGRACDVSVDSGNVMPSPDPHMPLTVPHPDAPELTASKERQPPEMWNRAAHFVPTGAACLTRQTTMPCPVRWASHSDSCEVAPLFIRYGWIYHTHLHVVAAA